LKIEKKKKKPERQGQKRDMYLQRPRKKKKDLEDLGL